MNEIDLIPQAYRTRRWQSKWLKLSVYAIAGIAGMLILTWSGLKLATKQARAEVEQLQARQSFTAQQRADLERLAAEKSELERQYRLLSDLRLGAEAGDMFVTVDRALTSDDVWFRNWQFQRAGVMVGKAVEAVNSGYFMVIPDGAEQLADDELRVQTQMSIHGQARDHSALSRFVRRLFVQPEIDDIRIHRTTLSDRTRADTVDFELSVVLSTDVRVQ